MTRTRATDAATVRRDYDLHRDGLQLTLSPTDTIGARPWAELRNLEIFPGSRLGDPSIAVPENYLPTSVTRRLSFRNIELSTLPFMTDATVDEAVRRALLALWLPRQTETGVRVYKPSVWVAVARTVLRMVGWIHGHRGIESGRVFADLTQPDIDRMLDATCPASRQRSDAVLLLRYLREAGNRGILSDFPPDTSDTAVALSGNFEPEATLKGRVAVEARPRQEDKSWQPFPDAFVTELMRRAFWIQRNLADQILRCWERDREIASGAGRYSGGTSSPMIIEARQRAIADFDWRDAEGNAITELPFAVTLSSVPSNAWPPRNGRALSTWVVIVQAMNLCTVAFATGARLSELGSATVHSLLSSSDGEGRFAGSTYKLVQSVGGQARDWPLHPSAVRAMEIQTTLSGQVRPEGLDHLWVLAGKTGSKTLGTQLLNLTEPIVSAVGMLGLTKMAGDDRPHLHRWRHTVARLVALSVVGAPQVLLDLFGHRDLEMTLRYMLSDPEIARDAIKVAEEASIVLAEEAIGETLKGLTSGPGARSLRDGLVPLHVDVEPRLRPVPVDAENGGAMRSGDEEYGITTVREAAEVLTLNGRYWSLVRPGVVCTKTMGQMGPCTQGRGDPDPGACRTGCDHRLELSLAQRQCRVTLDALLVEHGAAVADGADMLVENLEGQIKANLKRWEGVRTEVIARSDVARRIWTEAA